METVIPFRTAVPFWGQTSLISSSLSPKRDCGSEGVKDRALSQDFELKWCATRAPRDLRTPSIVGAIEAETS